MTEHEALAVRLGHMSKWFTDQSYEATTLREAQAALAATPARPTCRLCGLEDGACICAHLPSNGVYTDQPIFDAIAAATQIDSEPDGIPRIVMSAAKFIEVFNNHRDRALCTSLAATPAVGGGEREALASISRAVYRIREWAKGEGPYSEFIKEAAIIERRIEQIALAVPPASPLRGMEDPAPSPCSDLSIGELIEWLDNPQWTNGYLNSDAANHMSAAAELIERLVSSAPPEQPAASNPGEPIREDNDMSNDFDKGDDA